METNQLDFEQIKAEALKDTKIKNFTNALHKWSILRKINPFFINSYTESINILISQKKYAEAQSLYDESIKIFNMPNAQLLLCLANIKKGLNDFSEALKIWADIRRIFPENTSAYVRAANVLCELKEYDNAIALCQEALRKCKTFIHVVYGTMILIKMAAKDYDAALQYCAELRKLKPGLDTGYRRAALIFIELGRYDDADRMCEEAIKRKAVSLNLYRAYIISAQKRILPEAEKLQKIYERRNLLCKVYPDNFNESILLIKSCFSLGKYKPSMNILANNILSSILMRYKHSHVSANIQTDQLMPHKICFLCTNLEHLKYYYRVIKYICPCLADIVIERRGDRDQELINEYDIADYKILFGLGHAKNYDIIVLDSNCMAFAKYYGLPAKFIILPHDMTVCPPVSQIGRSSLCITMTPCETDQDPILPLADMDDKNLNLLSAIDIQARCELVHTGPYYIETCDYESEDKSIYKNIIRKKFNYNIDPLKPVLVIFEDELCDTEQFVNCANNLCNYANIIIKPLSYSNFQSVDKLDADINIYNGRELFPKLLIKSADFILAGFCSDILFISIMLGLKVIPYYSKKIKSGNMQRSYEDFINTTNTSEQLRSRLLKKVSLFDLLDVENIKNAVIASEYSYWYYDMLPTLQKEVFGDYIQLDGAHLTAEYIIRFSINGTLGKIRNAIYLRDKYFN